MLVSGRHPHTSTSMELCAMIGLNKMSKNLTETDFELRRTIVNEFGDFDLFLIDKANEYHKGKNDASVTKIKDWPRTTVIVPDVIRTDYVPYLSERFSAEFGLVWDGLLKYGLKKINENINEIGLGCNIQIYDMLRRSEMQPKYVDNIPLSRPTGIIYNTDRPRVSPSVEKELATMARNIGSDAETISLLAISISLRDSIIINNHFYSAKEGNVLSMSSKAFSILKMKNTLMLDFFSDTSASQMKTYKDRIQTCIIGDEMRIEGHRWALCQLRKRKKLCEPVPENPLKSDVSNYKKELVREIAEFTKESILLIEIYNAKEMKTINTERTKIKHIIKDWPFIGKKIISMFEVFSSNVDHMNNKWRM